jgi:membrane protein
MDRAAELAFWFLLGFFPMALSAVSVASLFHPAQGSQGTFMRYAGQVLPSSAADLVGKVLAQTMDRGTAWLSLLFALWASSSAIAGVTDTMNVIYGAQEQRPWWRLRLLSLVLALAAGVLLTTALLIIAFGPELLVRMIPFAAGMHVWEIVRWPSALLLLIGTLLCLYRFAPNVKQQRWKRLVPGSVTAAIVWVAVSAVLRLYAQYLSNFGLLYGSLATLIILMFWFYLSGIAILIGAEINSTLESASGKR